MSKGDIVKFKNMNEVRDYAEETGKVLLVHKDLILDVTTFQAHHPGGKLIMKDHHLSNIDEKMQFHQPLSITLANSMTIGSFQQDIERLVDPSRPLGQQIWDSDLETYLRIVTSPHWLFVKSPRFFKNDLVQLTSHSKWYVVPILPILLSIYFFYSVPSWSTFNGFTFALTITAGIFVFSLAQYITHRYFFHCEKYLPQNRFLRHLHFFTHGVHHMLPNDPDRLVLPPSLFIIFYFVVIELIMKRIIVFWDPILEAAFWSAFLIAYTFYDMFHYAMHFADMTKHKGSWFFFLFHKMQKYHLRHHFSGEDAGYGVSTPFWDLIFASGFKGRRNT